MKVSAKQARQYRHKRVLKKLRVSGRPRLIVRKTVRNIFAQIIDDEKHIVLAEASSLTKDMGELKNQKNKEASEKVGEIVAKRAMEKGITSVVFDRNGYPFHGKVKLLADSARSTGLKF